MYYIYIRNIYLFYLIIDMAKKIRKAKSIFVAIFGYLLSPLSWWNDLFINIPIAYLFGLFFGLISKDLFLPFMILGYWLTNILGLVMMHTGVKGVFTDSNRYTQRDFINHLAISVLYSTLIIVFLKLGFLKLPTEYFG